jgi:hypothetical protein
VRELMAWAHELNTSYHPPPNPPLLMQMYCDHLASTGGWVSPWYKAEL